MPGRVVRVVGMKAGGREHIVASVRTGDPVLLVPEPDNPYDPNAVAVYHLPHGSLLRPDGLRSSVKDPDGIGHVDPTDRPRFMARQAGYLTRDFAAKLALPADGVVGVVHTVRAAPGEWELDPWGEPFLIPGRVAGFDVQAHLPTQPARAR